MSRKRTRPHRPTPLGLAVKFYRDAAGLTQPELNELAGVSGVGMLESGARPNAYAETLNKLAAALSERLGYTITANDLRAGPPQRMTEEAASSLEELLSSPMGKNAPPEAITALRRFLWPPGFTPDANAWSMILNGLRMAKREGS